ncbi:S1 family peptidase [Streptomyces sp. ST2-7A]|uniref:S1 family peptidase n=1 Tax=Streptomyces sp. ST2-7A TaxID=2907214 RepID=UPI001F3DE550|nr:S1 family peptidase [Streptomyces sp. ST2-7A]MCE7081865.1 S1 family peptidase [Streptomyces sp. ST2-7A]
MRIKRTDKTSRTRHRRTPLGRLATIPLGLAAALALVLPGPAAAETGGEITADRLHAMAEAVATTNVGGTAWAVDEENGTVTVLVDETVSDKELRRIMRSAGTDNGTLEVEEVPGTLSPLLRGGDPILSTDGRRCTLGFNVHGGAYGLTAGHCTRGYPDWYMSNGSVKYLAPTVYSNFPGADYGYIALQGGSSANPSQVICGGSIVNITGTSNAYVGMPVTRSGSTTGCRSGSVTGLNFTVNYGGGDIVHGMIRTNVCAQPGDSGGPLWTGSSAVGILSGGSGDCTFGGTTFYEPIGRALSNHGLTIP